MIPTQSMVEIRTIILAMADILFYQEEMQNLI